jgi:hypothetical protein
LAKGLPITKEVVAKFIYARRASQPCVVEQELADAVRLVSNVVSNVVSNDVIASNRQG